MNLILQHWHGPLPRWAQLAERTVGRYAAAIGADYRRLTGFPMGKELGATAQKLFLLDRAWDSYDQVVMLDMDMVATPVHEDIFAHEGIGRLHSRGMSGLGGSASGRDNPALYKQGAPLFFGNCIKLTREERIQLRAGFDRAFFLLHGNKNRALLWDESILHHLIHSTAALATKRTLELPHDRFCDLPEEAHPKASLLHYCRARKSLIPEYVTRTYGERA